MVIKLKYSDEPIEVTGMSFDEEGVFKGYFKEGDPAAPVKLDEFYPKEDCTTISDTDVEWQLHFLKQKCHRLDIELYDLRQYLALKDVVKIADDDNTQ